jgi:hypothetical protein
MGLKFDLPKAKALAARVADIADPVGLPLALVENNPVAFIA